jgi:SulP family sulfate permease
MAMLSGCMLIGMGLLRFGYLANLLSHPVVSGFITASGVIIALSQLRHILGIDAHGETLPTLAQSLAANLGNFNAVTLATGLAATAAFLFWARSGLARLLRRAGTRSATAGILSKAGPVLVIVVTIAASVLFDFEGRGVALVGAVPSGLPAFALPPMDPACGPSSRSRPC